MSERADKVAKLLQQPFIVGDRVELRGRHGITWRGLVRGVRDHARKDVYVQWDGVGHALWYDHQVLRMEER